MYKEGNRDVNPSPFIPFKTSHCDEFVKVRSFRANFLVLIMGFNKLSLFNHTAISSPQLPRDFENRSLLLLLLSVGVCRIFESYILF